MDGAYNCRMATNTHAGADAMGECTTTSSMELVVDGTQLGAWPNGGMPGCIVDAELLKVYHVDCDKVIFASSEPEVAVRRSVFDRWS